MEVALHHRIYTHAVIGEPDTLGGRVVHLGERDAANVLSQDALTDLDNLLRKTVPSGNETAWVVRRFASGNDSYLCVVASYSDVVSDAVGRRGLMTHARLAKVEEGQSWFAAPALVEAALSFPIEDVCSSPNERRFEMYVDRLDAETTVSMRPVSVTDLVQLPRTLLSEFLVACFAVVGTRKGTQLALPRSDRVAITDLALAWCAMPSGLQRLSSWATAVEDGCPVDVVFMPSGRVPRQVAAASLVECAERYLDLFLDRPQDVNSILRNSEINDLVKLNEIVQRASGKREMPKKEKSSQARARQEGEPLAANAIAEMERQYQAMEKSLRTYIDQRFEVFEARPLAAPRRVPAWLTFTGIVVVLAALAVAILLLMDIRDRSRASANPISYDAPLTRAPRPAPDPRGEDRSIIAAAIQSAEERRAWANVFRELLLEQGAVISRAIHEIADRPDVNGEIATRLRDYAARIDRKQDLTFNGRLALRRLLTDAIAADVARSEGRAGMIRIDGELDDVAAILDKVKARYRVTNRSSTVTDGDLQSEIVLRWIGSRR